MKTLWNSPASKTSEDLVSIKNKIYRLNIDLWFCTHLSCTIRSWLCWPMPWSGHGRGIMTDEKLNMVLCLLSLCLVNFQRTIFRVNSYSIKSALLLNLLWIIFPETITSCGNFGRWWNVWAQFEKASSCMEDLGRLDSINSKEERPRKPWMGYKNH
jgi:hypothetical protein